MKNDYKKVGQLIAQIITVIVVFGIISYGLWRINLIRLPSFIGVFIDSEAEQDEDYANDGYEIFKHIGLDSSESDFEYSYPAVTPEKLSVLLDSAVPYDNFYWESTARVISSSDERIYRCNSRISGNKYNIEILDKNNFTVRKCISDGGSTVVIENSEYGGSKSRVYKRGLTDFYSDASIVSIDYFKNFDFTSVDTEILHIEKEGFNLVSVTYSYDRNDIKIKNNFLLSLDYGVVLFAESFEDDELVYALNTESIYSISSLDDELFKVTK